MEHLVEPLGQEQRPASRIGVDRLLEPRGTISLPRFAISFLDLERHLTAAQFFRFAFYFFQQLPSDAARAMLGQNGEIVNIY